MSRRLLFFAANRLRSLLAARGKFPFISAPLSEMFLDLCSMRRMADEGGVGARIIASQNAATLAAASREGGLIESSACISLAEWLGSGSVGTTTNGCCVWRVQAILLIIERDVFACRFRHNTKSVFWSSAAPMAHCSTH